jgi:Protein of Unknown function (DUF2784)
MRFLAAFVLAFHLAWILWVILGAILTRGRPWLTGFHIASIVWGIIAEAGPWPCPLTLAEQWLESQAGTTSWSGSWSGGFLVHTLDAIVYPNIPVPVIIGCALIVCGLNLLVYLLRFMRALRRRTARS